MTLVTAFFFCKINAKTKSWECFMHICIDDEIKKQKIWPKEKYNMGSVKEKLNKLNTTSFHSMTV